MSAPAAVTAEAPPQLTPFARLAKAAAVVRAWHQPGQHARNHAKPPCTECGFPWPCRTYTELERSQTA